MKKIVFWNLKNGSGKSTLALGLARVLTDRFQKVAIVDLDSDNSATDEQYDFNILDCPPSTRPEILEIVRTADIVIVPQHSNCLQDVDSLLEVYCDSKKTFLVPTWYHSGNKIFTTRKYQVTDNKLPWSIPAMESEVRKVCEELADSILGKPSQ